jgi:hypothetical protein
MNALTRRAILRATAATAALAVPAVALAATETADPLPAMVASHEPLYRTALKAASAVECAHCDLSQRPSSLSSHAIRHNRHTDTMRKCTWQKCRHGSQF